ncbi:MAG TPA: hypothetical protein VM345_01795 [Acidimicrobiales bacterium]|nr:hypothetical protein [Acidimicrobiales bacterium]
MLSYTLTYEKRPWTLNSERQGGYSKTGAKGGGGKFGRAARTREWRGHFRDLAERMGMPAMEAICVTAQPFTRNRVRPDTAACVGAVKAAIDGLVDAGVIVDDGPDVVTEITFLAPQPTGTDALQLIVSGWPAERDEVA